MAHRDFQAVFQLGVILFDGLAGAHDHVRFHFYHQITGNSHTCFVYNLFLLIRNEDSN